MFLLKKRLCGFRENKKVDSWRKQGNIVWTIKKMSLFLHTRLIDKAL